MTPDPQGGWKLKGHHGKAIHLHTVHTVGGRYKTQTPLDCSTYPKHRLAPLQELRPSLNKSHL